RLRFGHYSYNEKDDEVIPPHQIEVLAKEFNRQHERNERIRSKFLDLIKLLLSFDSEISQELLSQRVEKPKLAQSSASSSAKRAQSSASSSPDPTENETVLHML